MISRDEVCWLYRCIFSREPENESVILGHMHVHADFATARLALLSSLEFNTFYRSALQKKVTYRTPSVSKDQPFTKPNSIALATIVKNEARHIELMLRSCANIVSYVAVLDAFSTDETVLIAKNVLTDVGIPYCIAQRKFEDFSTSRNAAIDLVPKTYEWILMLDADEHFVRHDFGKVIALTKNEGIDAWTFPRYNFIDEKKLQPPINYPDSQARLFRNRKAFRFIGRVHENLANVEKWGHVSAASVEQDPSTSGPHVHHMGLVGLTAEQGNNKSIFYSQLLSDKASNISNDI